MRTARRLTLLALAVAALSGCGSSGTADLASEGRGVFVSAGCGSCHTTVAAPSHGTLGPNLDTSERLTRRQIRTQLDAGVGGMPSFQGRLTGHQQDAVAEFVYELMYHRR
ncbi:MAG: cytochrome c [Solirubrobacterales bacterium]|jgi:mono/diheme cytochrome c family protein|nr:cytochrome c [Solirubrobacterales bacterium]